MRIRSTPVSASPAMIARWIGAAPRQRGKQRRMKVEAAEPRRRQHRRRQNEAVGDDDADVGGEGAERLLRLGAAQGRRRHDRQAEFVGEPMDWGLGQLQAAPSGRLRRAGVDRDDLVAMLENGAQGRSGEIRRAHENDPHGRAHSIAPPGGQSARRAFPRAPSGASLPARRTGSAFEMNTPTPFHELAVRVYYEDTDFSGRVYHASYLRFMERGRTEWLRALGYEHGALAGEQRVVFAVRRLEIDYFAPAAIDDLLRVETRVAAVRGAAIDFAQTVARGDKTSRRSEDPRGGAARRPADAHSAGAARAVGERRVDAGPASAVEHAVEPRRERVEPLGDVFVEAAQIGAGRQRDDRFAQAVVIVEQEFEVARPDAAPPLRSPGGPDRGRAAGGPASLRSPAGATSAATRRRRRWRAASRPRWRPTRRSPRRRCRQATRSSSASSSVSL